MGVVCLIEKSKYCIKVIYVVKCMVYLCSKVVYKLSLATTTVALEKQMNRCNVKAEKVQCES